MISTYRLKANEITDSFVKSIQNNYKNKEIEITVQEVKIENEAGNPLKSDVNRQYLLQSIKEIRSALLQAVTIE